MKDQWVKINDVEMAMARAAAAYETALDNATNALIAADYLVATLETKTKKCPEWAVKNYRKFRKNT